MLQTCNDFKTIKAISTVLSVYKSFGYRQVQNAESPNIETWQSSTHVKKVSWNTHEFKLQFDLPPPHPPPKKKKQLKKKKYIYIYINWSLLFFKKLIKEIIAGCTDIASFGQYFRLMLSCLISAIGTRTILLERKKGDILRTFTPNCYAYIKKTSKKI